jgi:hypothetical protein
MYEEYAAKTQQENHALHAENYNPADSPPKLGGVAAPSRKYREASLERRRRGGSEDATLNVVAKEPPRLRAQRMLRNIY